MDRLATQTNDFVVVAVEYVIKLIKSNKGVIVDKGHILALITELIKELVSEKSFDWQIVVRVWLNTIALLH